MSDRGRHKLHGVIELAKRTIHELLIQLTHVTGRFNYLQSEADRAKQNIKIMLQFEVYGIVDENPLDAVADQCDKIQELGFPQWAKVTDQAMQDLVKHFQLKAKQDIRPTVNPLRCPAYLFGSDGFGVHYKNGQGQDKFANLIAMAEDANTYGTMYPKTATVCWNASQVQKDLTPNQVIDSAIWQINNLTQSVRKYGYFQGAFIIHFFSQ